MLFYKRRRETFAPLPICLHFLPTHPGHLLLYPFTDTPQEMFQHTHSIDGKLPHKFICFIKLLLKRPILSFQFLILSLHTLILVFYATLYNPILIGCPCKSFCYATSRSQSLSNFPR